MREGQIANTMLMLQKTISQYKESLLNMIIEQRNREYVLKIEIQQYLELRNLSTNSNIQNYRKLTS